MNNKDQYKRLLTFSEVIILLAVHTVIYIILWNEVFVHEFTAPLYRRGSLALQAVYPVMLVGFGKLLGLFDVSSKRRSELVFSHFGTTLFTNAFMYFLLVLAIRSYIRVWELILLFIGENILAVIWVIVIKKLNNRIYPPRDMLFIHGGYSYKEIAFVIQEKSERYHISETISIYEDSEKVKELIDRYHSILLSDIPAQERNDIVKHCYETGKRVYMLPKLSDILIRSASDVHISDNQIFLLKSYGLSFDQKLVKRAFDIVFSVLAIIISSWIMGIVALAIKLDDKGPVFYRQDRLTRDGKVFRIIKFRSMRVDAEKDGARLYKDHDDRVTRVGRFIRVTHLDEIPQLFNVLKGEMSVVGPRPERPEIMEEYIKNVPEFKYRLKVKGGMTGFAQVFGKYNTTPYNKLRLDLFYIQNYSFWMDLKCIVSTLKIFWRSETSEGVAEDQTTALKK
mgnify:CR=1 FL=1